MASEACGGRYYPGGPSRRSITGIGHTGIGHAGIGHTGIGNTGIGPTGIHHPGGPSLALATPRCDFRRFRVDLGTDFRGFSRLHRASDSTRSVKGRTSVFAGRRSTFKGSQTLQKERKSTKIHNQLLRRCFANAQHEENSIFPLSDATWRRF